MVKHVHVHGLSKSWLFVLDDIPGILYIDGDVTTLKYYTQKIVISLCLLRPCLLRVL